MDTSVSRQIDPAISGQVIDKVTELSHAALAIASRMIMR